MFTLRKLFFSFPGFEVCQPNTVYNEKFMELFHKKIPMTEPRPTNKENFSQLDDADSIRDKGEQQQKKRREAQREKDTSMCMESGYTKKNDRDECEDDD